MSRGLPQRLLAEALGTALLVATVVGSGIMAANLTRDVALQLLANTIPTGAILVVLITILGPVSGAHFNPAVSLVFALRRELSTAELAPYVIAQCVGGVAGTVAAHLMFGLAPLVIGANPRTGPSLWFAEVVATFTLVLAILGALRAAYWFTASTSFANPAVTLARSFTGSFAGIALHHAPMFILAQLAGALAAAALARTLFDDGGTAGREP
jgi:glycerol uptake facilitator-like aquaporin